MRVAEKDGHGERGFKSRAMGQLVHNLDTAGAVWAEIWPLGNLGHREGAP